MRRHEIGDDEWKRIEPEVRQLELGVAALRPVVPPGVWEKVFRALQEPDLEWLMLDSTVIRARQQAAGEKKGAPAEASTARPWAVRAAAFPPRRS